jgi:hypothetical protein
MRKLLRPVCAGYTTLELIVTLAMSLVMFAMGLAIIVGVVYWVWSMISTAVG